MPRRARVDHFALEVIVQQQHGLILHRQLAELGFPGSTLAFRIRPEGPWQRLLPGVYLTNRGAPTRQQRAHAALLYAGEGALLTGPEAMSRYGMRSTPQATDVQVLVPDTCQRSSTSFARLVRTRRLPGGLSRQGLPCAPVSRAVLDTCRQLRDLALVRAIIAEAVQQGRCGVEELACELREGPIRGSAPARSVLAEVREGVRSAAEGDARELFLRHGLPQPRWNVDLYTEDGTWVARPDAWYEEEGVAFEVDSREWHLAPADWEQTMRRHMRMTVLGIAVLHVTPSRLRREGPAVAAEVRAALNQAAGRPRPLINTRLTSD
jgi:hypothetical protein